MKIIGAGAGVWISSPSHDIKLLSFKVYFECTNNVAEYEYLILGIKALKTMKFKKISIYGDSQLVIDQVRGVY
jgi:ribonuclease HI